MVKLHAVIKWGLFQQSNNPQLKNGSTSSSVKLRKIINTPLSLVNLGLVSTEDIIRYIEPYDIFDDDEYYDLIKEKEDQFSIHKLAGNRANKTFTFGLCNYPNEISINEGKNVLKTGSRQGVVVLSENVVNDNCVLKFKVLNEGRPGLSCIGFGICDKSCLNFCPFVPTRNFGPFITYYTYKKDGYLNMGDCGDKLMPKDYEKPFLRHDCINLIIDIDNNMISFGVNDIMYPEKSYMNSKFKQLHLAIWLNEPGDEVQLIYEY